MGAMPEIIIDEEFQFLLPSLDKDTFALLEENILENGIRDPIVLWGNIIIDGHNRYSIAMKHEISFNTLNMEFDSRDDAVIWIISTQVSRRNLTPIQLSYYRGRHYISDKRSRGDSGRFRQNDPKAQNGPLEESTATRLAKKYKVSRNTIKRDAKVAEALGAIGRESPEAKREILSGAVSITRKQLGELLAGSEDDVADIAASINDGTFERRRSVVPAQNGDDYSAGQASGKLPPEEAFAKLASSFLSELQALIRNYDSVEVKTALRFHIDKLEDLYSRM